MSRRTRASRVCRLLIPLLAVGAALAATAESGAGSQWSIVATYAIPEGASGLAWDGTWLYCGIYGPDGGRMYRIDPADGTYTLLFTGPHEDAFGLTYDGQYLWTTDHPGSVSSPAVAMQMDWSGNLTDQFELPDHYMSGIAYDAGDFRVSRYYEDPGHIYTVTSAGAILDSFDGPDDQPWDLCIENDSIWVADYWGDTLYQLDAATGAVLDSHPSEGVDPAGVVWDGTHLWYCDNGEGGNDFLYKVDLAGSGTPSIGLPLTDHDYGAISIGDSVTWNMTVNNTGSAALDVTGVDFGLNEDLSCPTSFPLTIPIGGTTQLPIVYAPSGFGALAAIATVSSTDPIHPEEPVALAGYGVYPDATIDLSQTAHGYGAVRLNATTRWFVDVQNQGNQVLTISDITIDEAHFSLDDGVSLPLALATLETVQVGLWFSPDTTAGVAATVTLTSNDAGFAPATVILSGSGDDSPLPMGTSLWSDLIDTGFDNSPKAMASIPDISGDGVADLIVCSEDDFVRCYNGNADGTADVLWANDFGLGYVYSQKGLQIIPDLDEDGYDDVVVGTAGGQRVIRAPSSGRTGAEIWTHDTDEYGDGGWVYQVDARFDYNGDDILDVLAATGDDAADTGPKRVYCLNGVNGVSIWERGLAGPVFAVIGVADLNGDGQADVLAGASNESETQGVVYAINGATSTILWPFAVSGSSVWALGQLEDLNGDGVLDVIAGDFLTGNVHGLSGRTGAQLYVSGGLGVLTRFERLDDVNDDGHPDFFPAHSADFGRMISGLDGTAIWTTPLVDNSSVAARIADVSGDGVNDVVVGTLFTSNFTYFLDGADGSVLQSASYGTPVDAITAIPDVTGDGSWELVAGGRNGLVTCISGGLDAAVACPGDTDGDGQVNVDDLNAVISDWGTDGSANGGDLTGPIPGSPPDGIVNVNDLNAVISNWGICQ